jgi:membrane associated rhomboid family serine protease
VRQQDPEIDQFFAKNGTDAAAMEEVQRIFPRFPDMLRDASLQAHYYPGERVSLIQEAFALDTKKVMRGQVWRLLTHAFCHDRGDIFHIIFNMLFLYWFGCTLESMYTSREFLLFYLAAVLAAALAYVALDLYTGTSVPAVGASGAVMAVIMLYAWHFPRDTINLMWVIPVQIRILVILYVIWDVHPVLLTLGGDRMNTGVAHAAHLGGLAFGFLYAKFQWRLAPLGEHLPGIKWQRRPTLHVTPSVSDADMDRVDQILEKISLVGESNLTDEERTFLRETSGRMKKRRRGS